MNNNVVLGCNRNSITQIVRKKKKRQMDRQVDRQVDRQIDRHILMKAQAYREIDRYKV